jgi:antitoxin component YwqK of YwqJK toxin-antitoxin module
MLSRTKVAMAILSCAVIAGCSQTIDSRQIDWNHGLVYKHGSTDPFTGTVAWKDEVPNDLIEIWGKQFEYASRNLLASCEVHYTKGLIDGPTSCANAGGNTIMSVGFKDEKLDGAASFKNTQTGARKEIHFASGRYDGSVKTFGKDDKPVDDSEWAAGVMDGHQRKWNAQGELVVDVMIKGDQILSGTVKTDHVEANYKDGQFDGPAAFYVLQMQANGQAGRALIGKGNYEKGQRVGEWTDASDDVAGVENIEKDRQRPTTIVEQFKDQFGEALNQAIGQRALRHIDHSTSNWVAGQLEGPVKVYDAKNTPLLNFTVKNGKVEGPVNLVSADGQMQTFQFQGGAMTAGLDQLEAKPDPNAPSIQKIIADGGVGNLTVMGQNADGYPIYQLECGATGDCVGPTGQPIGKIADVAQEMSAIKLVDVAKYQCNVLCQDSQGNIVGRKP